jgi:hypothetical protein
MLHPLETFPEAAEADPAAGRLHRCSVHSRSLAVRDLTEGHDTVAGVAHRTGLPVATLLRWCDLDGLDEPPVSLAAPGVPADGSRFTGPC